MEDWIKFLHHDYILIAQMKSPLKVKARLLSVLLAEKVPNAWHVIGITLEAYKVFKKNNFAKVKNMGINRSHLQDRHITCKEMLENKAKYLDVKTWWEYYINNDKTILTTSSENNSGSHSKLYKFKNNDNLFRAAGYSWRYTREEKTFLQNFDLK